MNTQKPEKIGALISKTEASLLKKGFLKRYHDQISSLSIRKESILKVLNKTPNICGIKFLYGMISADQPASKFIMLIPCFASKDESRPLPHISTEGFYTNKGHQIELLHAWESLCNYVKYMRACDSELGFDDVSRSCFFGVESLKQLLSLEDVENINYHFGYDDFTVTKNICDKYRIVLEPISFNRHYDIYMDHGGLFGESKPLCFIKTIIGAYNHNSSVEVENQVNVFRNYRSRLLSENHDSDPIVEMYYQVTDTLVEKITHHENKAVIYQDIYKLMSATNEKLRSANTTTVRDVLIKDINFLVNTELLN